MSVLVELRDRIQSTSALIMEYERSIAEIKGQSPPPSLLANVRSLEKLKKRLEAQFLEVASELELEVYRYRILNESERITLAAISEAWGKFDDFFTSVYSELKKAKPSPGKKPVQPEPLKLGYGYSYAGSIGVVVTVPKDVGFYTADPIEDASQMVFDMIEARNLDSIAKNIGPVPVQKLHSWFDVHIRTQSGLALEWRSQQEVKRSVVVEYQSLAKIQTTIADTTTTVGLDVIGELQGAYIEPKKFKIRGDNGEDYEGTFESAITQEHAASVPARYSARIIQTTKIIVLGKEPETTFFLESLKPLT
jgi:hypothetical protein